jgi:hypothetical protein
MDTTMKYRPNCQAACGPRAPVASSTSGGTPIHSPDSYPLKVQRVLHYGKMTPG